MYGWGLIEDFKIECDMGWVVVRDVGGFGICLNFLVNVVDIRGEGRL